MARSNIIIRKPTAGAPSIVAHPGAVVANSGVGGIVTVASPRRVPAGVAATAAAGIALGPSPPFDPATTRYVRQGATGSGSGLDWTNALPSIPSTKTRGFTYYVADGSYGAQSFSTAASGSQTITFKKATVSDHGTNSGWDNTFGDGEAVFGRLNFSSPWWVLDGVTGGGPGSWTSGFGFRVLHTAANPLIELTSAADNVWIKHFDLQGNNNNSGGGSIAQDAFEVNGADSFRASHFYTHSLGRAPCFLVPAPNAIFEYGYFGDFNNNGSSSVHAEVVSAWNGSFGTHLTFRYNILTYFVSTGGIIYDNNASPSAELRVYGNVFVKLPGTPNWSQANGLIGGWTGGNGEEFHNARVYNNTFINTESGGQALSTFPDTASNNIARNNLFYDVGNVGGGSSVWQTVSHNHFISSSSIGTNASTGSGDPFVDWDQLDFRLLANTAPGMDVGEPYNVDMYGNTRTTWTRGAIEFQE